MKVIQGLNQELNGEEDTVTVECTVMEVEKGVEEIKPKVVTEEITDIAKEEDQPVTKVAEETNGHCLKNGVGETPKVIENGVNNSVVKVLEECNTNSELILNDFGETTTVNKSESPINLPGKVNKEVQEDLEDITSDNDTIKSSDKDETASAYETATTCATSPRSLDETFESTKSDQDDTAEVNKDVPEHKHTKKPEDTQTKVATSEDLVDHLEKLNKNFDDKNSQEELLYVKDDQDEDEQEPEKQSSEASRNNLLQEAGHVERDDLNLVGMTLSSPSLTVESEKFSVKEEPRKVSLITDEITNGEVEPKNVSLTVDHISLSKDETKNITSDEIEKMECEDTIAEKMECEDTVASKSFILETVNSIDNDTKDDHKDANIEEKENYIGGNDQEETKSIIEKENEMDNKVKDLEKEASKETTVENLTDLLNEKESTDSTMDAEDDDCTITTAETPEPVVDLDEALGELDQIDSYTKSILNDDEDVKSDKKTGAKRGLSDSSESLENKKAKIDTEATEEDMEPEAEKSHDSEEEKDKLLKCMKKTVKRQSKKLTKSELENILSNKMVEMMTNKSEMGKLRQQCDSYRDVMEKWKKRAEALRKQCSDLSTVMRKYIVDTKNKPKEKVRPVLITRSVGLQVMSSEQRRQQLSAGRGGLIRKGPGRPPGSSPSKPTTPSVATGPRIVPKVVQNGVRNGPSPVRSTENVARPTVSTPQSRPNWQVGGTTIMITSPSKGATPPVQQAPTTAQPVTSVAQPSTSQGAAKTIDVVDIDLSDDEDKAEPAAAPQRSMHSVQRGMVRPGFGGRGRGGHQFIMTKDDKLVPIQPQQQIIRQQNQPRMMTQAGMRPGPMMMAARPRSAGPRPMTHPAPLPPMPKLQPSSPAWKTPPPRPALKISRVANGIVLSWNMSLNLSANATITSYQLYAYQESNQQRPDPNLWKKVGDVKALPLPMACTLTQFTRGNKYHFAVRAMDLHQRVGNFSEPSSIFLN